MEEVIEKNLADEAYINATVLKNRLKTKEDAFKFFASMNLLNAYVKKDYADSEYKKRYIIKDYVAKGIEQVIENDLSEVDVFIDKDVVYINIMDRQFSFHNIQRNRVIDRFKTTKRNKFQKWSGVRLQPICVTIYNQSKVIK